MKSLFNKSKTIIINSTYAFLTVTLIVIISVFAASCNSNSENNHNNPGVIYGNLTGVDAGTNITLRSFKNGTLVEVAKSKTKADGKFELTPPNPLSIGYHQIIVDGRKPLVLITDSTESPIITANITDGNGYMVGATIEGSSTSAILSTYYNELIPIQDSLIEIQKAIRNKTIQAQSDTELKMKKMIAQIDRVSVNFIKEYPESPAILAALENLNPKQHSAAYKSVLKSLSKDFSNSHYYRMLKDKYDKSITSVGAGAPTALPPARNKVTKKNGKFGAGDLALDIEMPNPEGKTLKLSDLRGKVVLLDFWASWCGPCRRENPHVVHAYNKYNSDGFEVFSVSLDSNTDKWKKAIEQDGLIWPNHVSDLKGWRNAASQAYGISSIPHTVLIGRDGKIIKTHLRGASLEAELVKLFE